METRLADFIRDTPQGREADAILRSCVHCGFCTATCPTYQLLGDELDGPRGRIYLIKQMLEGADVTASTQLHLDRCLTCRSCETTCPSGVRYGRLVDIGRRVIEQKVERGAGDRTMRWLLRKGLTHRGLFGAALLAGRLARPLLPRALATKIPARSTGKTWPNLRHARRMLVLEGCVQPVLAPSIDAALARVLDRIGISLVRAGGGCCGAISEHLGAHEEALDYVRRNIDAWWPHIERGAEAILASASGCGVVVKDYAYLLRDDENYAGKAKRVSELARDPVEVVAAEWKRFAPMVAMDHGPQRVAFQAPCSLQHGQQLVGQGRGNPRGHRPRADRRQRRASLLRIGRDLLDPAGRSVAAVESQQAGRARSRCSRRDRHRQHWVPHASGQRYAAPGAALDRSLRRSPAVGRAVGLIDVQPSLNRADFRHFLAIPTRWMDNDSYGHVNNVVYYAYFDTVVNELPHPRGRARHPRAGRRSASWSRPAAASTARCRFRT